MTLVGADLFRADRQTDGQIEERRDEANSRFVEILRTRQKKIGAHILLLNYPFWPEC